MTEATRDGHLEYLDKTLINIFFWWGGGWVGGNGPRCPYVGPSLSLAKTNVFATTQQLNFKLSLYLKEARKKKKKKTKTKKDEKQKNKTKNREKKSDFYGVPALYLYPLKN